jgi:putative aldouronate transport system substrate-binding protein
MKRILPLLLVLTLLVGIVPGSLAEASAPQKEFTIVCQAGGNTNPSVADWWIWKAYEKMTGIHINWIEVPESAMSEKKNLLMASNDRPDAFWQCSWSTEELMSYGSQGAFVNLAPYLDEYAPNLKTLLTDEVQGGLAAVTMPDGGIYGTPWVMTDLPQENARFYLNKTWLKNLGLEIPTSIDELTAVFAAFKEKDANGNGDPNDEYPIYMQPEGISMLNEMLCGSYGVGNNGFKPISEDYYIDTDNKVQFLYTSGGMKALWKQMADWWTAGYFYPETFGKYEYENWVTDGTVNKVVGMYGWGDAAFLYGKASEDYVGINALKGPNGDCVQSWCDFPVRTTAVFTITDACDDPATLLKWVDYFYGKDGTAFAAYGLEGETYTKDEKGNIRYMDSITKYEGGAQLGAWQYGLFVFGGNFPWRSFDSTTMEIARKQDDPSYTGEKFSDYLEDSLKYAAKLMPGLTPTAEEAEKISAIKTDVDTYIKEARMNFVTGTWNFDSDWDAYVKQLEQMGINDYVTIKQAQYERYEAKK